MRTASRYIIIAALLAFTPHAHGSNEDTPTNVFNADLSHPTIANAINEFEKVCLPFIVHETKLTPEQDREVFKSRMLEIGYGFENEKAWEKTSTLKQFPPISSRCHSNLPEPTKDGKYTIFHGLETIAPRPCLLAYQTTTPVRLTKFTRQIFQNAKNDTVSAYLTWQDIPDGYPKSLQTVHARTYAPKTIRLKTTFLPASSCQIHTTSRELTPNTIVENLISQDADWEKIETIIEHETGLPREDSHYWRQCSTQDDEHYVYTIGLQRTSFSVKVKTLQGDDFTKEYNCQSE